MARGKNYSRRGPSRKKTTGKPSYEKEMTSLAYKMGQIERGKKNSESKVAQAFARGVADPKKQEKRTLF